MRLAKEGALPKPQQNCEVHVGAEDWQSNPINVQKLGKLLDILVTVVPNTGHTLGKQYVGRLLKKWVNNIS